MIDVYKSMDIDPDMCCSCCGSTRRLSHSHLISRRVHRFASDPRNIVYHCMSIGEHQGCHELWEQIGVRSKMPDYIDNMERIKSMDVDIWRKMIVDDYFYLKKNSKEEHNIKNYTYICTGYDRVQVDN
ncbi:MAG: hypothetical protein ACRDD8_06140 [Bacteroidales bacterium]